MKVLIAVTIGMAVFFGTSAATVSVFMEFSDNIFLVTGLSMMVGLIISKILITILERA